MNTNRHPCQQTRSAGRSRPMPQTVLPLLRQRAPTRSADTLSHPMGEGQGEGKPCETLYFGTLLILVAGTLLIFTAGCATKSPPTPADIRAQSGTLTNMVLTNGWKAGGSPGVVADNWLAAFDDAQLNALIAEAMTNNPDLRVASTKVEQAAQYVELAKAALRPAVNLLGTGGFNMGGGDIMGC